MFAHSQVLTKYVRELQVASGNDPITKFTMIREWFGGISSLDCHIGVWFVRLNWDTLLRPRHNAKVIKYLHQTDDTGPEEETHGTANIT